MDPQLWAEVEAIFAEAADADTIGRSALIAARCADRPVVRAEVEALLAAHDRASEFLEPTGGPDQADRTFGLPAIGAAVGPFRITGLLGEGGMAAVFRAERQDGTFEQHVAIKIVRTLLTDDESARRFRSERQILAALHHPHIVTLLDGGTLPDGRPYLVMEFVDGVPITQFCRQAALSLDARLRLFRDVCAAVQYAHRHGIVHRDLKPANILVTPDGVPKVLDFGVAKLLEGPTGLDYTATGQAVGPLTPNYASPEQLRGLPITTASDVYALGVLLYELVTGTRPYDTAGQPLDRMVELVLRTDPPRPSIAVKTITAANASAAAVAAAAHATIPVDRRRLAGDLDAIVMKALSKEPERRYASAGEFSDDVARFLGGKPVLAREPSTLYVIRKLARRHRAAVAIGLASLIGVLAALGVALWQRQAALGQQARAERRFNEVRRIANTLIFDVNADLARIPGSTAVRKKLVDEATKYLEGLRAETAGDPELQLEVAGGYRRIAEVLSGVTEAGFGDRQGAIAHLQQARALLLPLVQSPSATPKAALELVNVNGSLSANIRSQGKGGDANALIDEAYSAAERIYARMPQDPVAREAMGNAYFWMAVRQNDKGDELTYWRRAGEIYSGLLAESPDDVRRIRAVALVEKYIGSIFLVDRERLKEGDPHFRRALELDERRLASNPDNAIVLFDVAIDLANLGRLHDHMGDFATSVPFFERSLAIRKRLANSDPDDIHARLRVGIASKYLAYSLMRLDRLDEAFTHASESVAVLETVAAKTGAVRERSELVSSLVTLGYVERARKHMAQACTLFTRAEPMAKEAGDRNPGGEREYWLSIPVTRAEVCGANGGNASGSGRDGVSPAVAPDPRPASRETATPARTSSGASPSRATRP